MQIGRFHRDPVIVGVYRGSGVGVGFTACDSGALFLNHLGAHGWFDDVSGCGGAGYQMAAEGAGQALIRVPRKGFDRNSQDSHNRVFQP